MTGTALAGTTFQPIPAVNAGSLNDVSNSATTDAWAVGSRINSQDTTSFTLTQHWNGQSWTVVPSANPFNSGNILSAVVDLSSSNAWAVGYGENSDGFTQPLIEHWNGKKWRVVAPAIDSGNQEDAFSSVAAVSANNIWVVGSHFDHTLSGTDGLIEHWNGSTWSIVPNPNSFLNSDIVAVPNLDTITVVSSTDI